MNSWLSVPTFRRLVASAMVATLASVPLASENSATRQTVPGEGVICFWSIYIAVSEVGNRCYPGQHAEVQAELQRAVSLIDAYVLANSKPPPTQEQIAKFKSEQGNVGAPKEFLCRGDPDQMYLMFVKAGALSIRTQVDALLSRPGKPTWGTCL